MFDHGFPSDWSTLKKLIWLKGAGIIGGASAVWKTVTGTLIHLTDALASPMQKCEVALEPIQDLHGQDAPYPAGGGKQLFDIDNPLFTAVEVGYLTSYGSKVEDGKLYNGGQKGITAGSGVTIPAEEGNYTLSFYINGESASFQVRAVTLNQDNSWATYTTIYSHTWDDVTGQQTITVAFPSGYTHLYFAAFSATKYGSWETNVMIEKGSTASPWQPFANICPITGWTGCEVNVTGKVLGEFDNDLVVSGYSKTLNATERAGLISLVESLKPGDYSYGLVYQNLGLQQSKGVRVVYTDGTTINFGIPAILTNPTGYVTGTITIPSGLKDKTLTYAIIYYGKNNGSDDPVNASIPKLIVEAQTDTPLETDTYSGTTASVTFPDSAGTVYGGTVDLVSGVLTVDRTMTDLGTKIYSYQGKYLRFMAPISGLKPTGSATVKGNAICTIYKCLSPNDFDSSTSVSGIMAVDNGGSYLFIRDLQYNDADIFKTAMDGVKLVYELAEPIIYQLTPQQISSLRGMNNIWSNSNGDTTIIYKAQSS